VSTSTIQTYAVRAGDSLASIAARFDVDLERLVEFNGWYDLCQVVLPGQMINIPPPA
jgi:LysM repeat protein